MCSQIGAIRHSFRPTSDCVDTLRGVCNSVVMGQPSTAAVNTGPRSRRVVIAASIGTVIEAYDLLLYGYFASIFAQLFFPRSDPTAALLNTFAIFAVGFAARPLGGIVFGHIGDRLGRRTALVASILVMAGPTLAIGLLPTYRSIGVWAPALLLLCRLLQGFSAGGEIVGANILLLEHASAGRSGRWVSANQVATNAGIAAAATTSLVMARVLSEAELASWGWRLPFFAAVPLALVGVYLRLRIPDSPAFRAVAAKRLAFPLGTALRTAKRGMMIYSAWWAMVSLGAYLLIAYMVSYLIRVVGMDSAGAFGANLAAVVILAVGAITGGYLVDRYPPRAVALASAIGIALTTVPSFLIVQQGSVVAAILGQALWAACLGVAATVGATLSLSLFPVEVRYTATGFAYNLTFTLFGSTAPYVSVWLIARTGNPFIPAWYLVVVALISLTVAGIALRRRSL
jgi:MHS family proline/betaine transporter-like MFS transporter